MDSWNLLRILEQRYNLPWIVSGDFNDILSAEKKEGVAEHPWNLINGFRSVLEDCGLRDVACVCYIFTWEIGRNIAGWVRERMDKAVASDTWLNLVPNCVVSTLAVPGFDHEPIILDLMDFQYGRNIRKFCFDNFWFEDSDLHEVVKSGWVECGYSDIIEKKAACYEKLDAWITKKNMDIQLRKRELIRQMKFLKIGVNLESHEKYKRVHSELNNILAIEEIKWKQRAKSFWLTHGDKNSKFFHS